jgi:hypothetical protein
MAQKTIQVTADDSLAYDQHVEVCTDEPTMVHVHFECSDAAKATALADQLKGQFGGLACGPAPAGEKKP